jgi:hypothetical protein
MWTAQDRRSRPRSAADLDLRIDAAGRSGFARVRDISGCGVRFVADRALQPMTQVGLVIVLPPSVGGREISCRGAVVRSVPVSGGDGRAAGYETAIFFTEMRDSDRLDVEEFVSSRVRGSSEL